METEKTKFIWNGTLMDTIEMVLINMESNFWSIINEK